MDAAAGPICEDMLEKLSFERCKWWSSFFESLAEREDGEVYNVLEIDEIIKDNVSVHEEREIAEEAEEVNIAENDEHHSLLTSIMDQGKSSYIESPDVQDLLNVTRPILEKHERKWKNAGLDRILNTFDSVRIEKEVGGWMRRTHAVVAAKEKSYTDSDTDSSISCDTGRYIRSVRKNSSTQRSKCITSIKRFQNTQKLRHKHGMLIEATTYRAYKCNCLKYNLNIQNQMWESGTCQQVETTDTDEDIAENKRTSFLSTASGRRKSHLRRYVQKYETSSDSDYISPKNRALNRRKFNHPVTDLSPFKNSLPLCSKPRSSMESRKRLMSMIEPRYETPPKYLVSSTNLINTAPSKVSNKREAAKKALVKINSDKKRKEVLKTKNLLKESKRISKDTQRDESSSECNTSFENNLKQAIQLSLKTYKRNQKNCATSNKEKDDCVINLTDSISYAETRNGLKNLKKAVRRCSDSISKTPISSTESKKSTRVVQTIPVGQKRLNQDKPSEDTFLTNVENICNSTALNGVAARKQLLTRLPSIIEISETFPTTPGRVNKNKSQTSDYLPTNRKYSLSPLNHSPSQNVYNLLEVNNAKDGKDNACEPRRKIKRKIIHNKKKSSNDYIASPILLSSDTSQKSIDYKRSNTGQKPKRIQLYAPQKKEHTEDGYFQVTRELLSSVIGEKDACRFFKHHLGRLSFPKTSTVYYCPPEVELSSSDSDDDPLQKAGRCGELFESLSHYENGAF